MQSSHGKEERRRANTCAVSGEVRNEAAAGGGARPHGGRTGGGLPDPLMDAGRVVGRFCILPTKE